MGSLTSPRNADFKVSEMLKSGMMPQAKTPLAAKKVKMLAGLNCTYVLVYIPCSPPIYIRRYLVYWRGDMKY